MLSNAFMVSRTSVIFMCGKELISEQPSRKVCHLIWLCKMFLRELEDKCRKRTFTIVSFNV